MFAVSRFTSRCGHDANHKYCFTRVTALTVNQSLCGVTFLTELVSVCMNLISIPCASAGSTGEFSIRCLFISLVELMPTFVYHSV